MELADSTGLIASLGAGIIIYLAIIALLIASLWKIFAKADKPGWAAIIPLYNTITLLEIVKKPVWWIFLLFIPFVNLVLWIIITNLISKKFGKGVGFTLGLLFLPIIFYPILAFGDAKYEG